MTLIMLIYGDMLMFRKQIINVETWTTVGTKGANMKQPRTVATDSRCQSYTQYLETLNRSGVLVLTGRKGTCRWAWS